MAFCQFLPTFSNIRIKRLLLMSNVLQIQSFKLPWSRAATISEDKDILSLLGEFASLDQENSEPFHLHFNQSCMKNGNWGLYSRIHIYNSKQDYLFSHIWFPLCVLLLFTIVTGLEYWNLASPWMIWTTLCLSWFINIL